MGSMLSARPFPFSAPSTLAHVAFANLHSRNPVPRFQLVLQCDLNAIAAVHGCIGPERSNSIAWPKPLGLHQGMKSIGFFEFREPAIQRLSI